MLVPLTLEVNNKAIVVTVVCWRAGTSPEGIGGDMTEIPGAEGNVGWRLFPTIHCGHENHYPVFCHFVM